MALKIEQDFEYVGNDYWRWWVWIVGSDEELDQIDRVIYTLHPTFRDPVHTVTDRSTKFLMRTAGWGIFQLHALVAHKDGSETPLTHDLQLRYPDGTPTTV
jgi:transcription initiation factor IIF auxiliary subunit